MSDSCAPAMSDMEGTGGIGADKFQQDFFLLADL